MQSYVTEKEKLFNCSFSHSQYFHCKACKVYYFTSNLCEENSSVCASTCLQDNKTCSYVEMDDAVLYVGDIDHDKPDSKYKQYHIWH